MKQIAIYSIPIAHTLVHASCLDLTQVTFTALTALHIMCI
jgi:hypothetical protein